MEGDDIVWWPGIIYEGFLELMVDLDYRLSELRAACLVNHNRTKQTKPAVIYFIGVTQPPFACSIAYVPTSSGAFGLDNNGQDGPDAKNYFNSYEEMHNTADAARSVSAETKAMFHRSVALADRLMARVCVGEGDAAAAGSGGAGGNSPLRIENGGVGDDGARRTASLKVSPDGNGPLRSRTSRAASGLFDVKVVNVHRSMNTPPAAGREEEDGSRFSQLSGKGGVCGKAQRTSTTPATADTSVSSAVLEKDKWKKLWNILTIKGWKVMSARKFNNLHDWYYVRPDCDPGSKDYELGIHYFRRAEDVILWCRNHRDTRRSLGKGDNHPSPEGVSPMSDISSDLSSASSVSSPPRDMNEVYRLIKNKEEWGEIWKQLRSMRWHWKQGRGLVDTFYIRPRRDCTAKDKLGEDYFDSPKAVLNYLKKQKEPGTAQKPVSVETVTSYKVKTKRKRGNNDISRCWGKG